VRPDSNVKFDAVQLTANETRHALPSDCVTLIDMPRNMGSDGLTAGAPINRTTRQVIEEHNSTWHSATGETTIELFAYDPETPGHVWTYPRVHASTAVYADMAYSYNFTEVVYANITTTDVACADQFVNPVLDWMLHRANRMDTDALPNWNASIRYEQSFYQGLGIEFKAKMAISEGSKK
jgi:hypothetical protein